MSLKLKVAKILDITGVNSACFHLSKMLYGDHIRVVNYHSTPQEDMRNFEAQLDFYKRNYVSIDSESELENFFASARKDKKPGLIISFDDGYRNNFDYARPLLEKYGFTGWFFIPTGLIDASNTEQATFAGKQKDKLAKAYPDGRYLMTWDELALLNQKHVVGCHTFSHHRMNVSDSDDVLQKEITFSKQLLERKLQTGISTFCWVGGEEHTYTRQAAKLIAQNGYKYSFMTNTYPVKRNQSPLQLQRSNIESDNPLPLVRFQLNGLMDLVYYGKRKRVNSLTADK